MNSLFCNPISGIWLQKDCLAVGLFLVWHGMKRKRPKFIWLADASVWHGSFWTKWQSLYLSFVSNCLSAKRILFHCLFRGIDFYWYVSCKKKKVFVYTRVRCTVNVIFEAKKTCFSSFKHHLNYSCLFSQRQHQPLDTGGVISQHGDSMQ